jgi:hypothetical protein
MGGIYWIIGCLVVATVILGGGAVDVVLHLRGLPTITTWLRSNPAWFWYPAVLLVILFLHLGLHLFAHSR